jgi:hypothetical protein
LRKIQQNQSGLNANQCRLKAASKRHNGLSDILRDTSPARQRARIAKLSLTTASLASAKAVLARTGI